MPNKSTTCFICQLEGADIRDLFERDACNVNCLVCGQYEISRTACVNLRNEDSHLKKFLSAHTRQKWEYEREKAQITSSWQDYAAGRARSSVAQKLDKLMSLARHRTPQMGDNFKVDFQLDYPMVDAASPQTLDLLLKHAISLELLRSTSKSDYVIPYKGWQYLESQSGFPGAPLRAFVAMAFHQDISAAYEEGIRPAIETDCGLICVRVDRVEHNEKIYDRILAEIRRCEIVVADFTLHRPGVYFEAGFALALGKTVIWGVREDGHKKTHFDTRQYNHILWRDPPDYRQKLADRLRATALAKSGLT